MNFKKYISILIALTVVILCFASCKTQKENDTLGSTSDGQSTDTSENDFVSLSKTDTGFGLVTIPKFNENKLNKESASMANKMFADISDGIIKNIEEYKATSGDAPSKDEPISPLCTAKTAIVREMLSVLVEYSFYFSSPQNFCVAVNFNTKTGEVINPQEVVKSVGFTEDEVKTALKSFADRSLFDEWERSAFADLAEKKSLPDGWGDPSLGWQDSLNKMVQEYDSEPKPSGKEWDKLLCYPTVFVEDNNSLFVGANIPTQAEGGFYTTMVKIGHSNAQTLYLNPIDRNGEKYKANGAMTENAAFEAVASTMGLDNNWKTQSGAKYKMEAEYIDNMKGADGVFYPSYVIKVFTDEGTHITTVGRYAVGAFTGMVWEYDTAADKWNLCPNGTGYLPEDIYTGMQQDSILAAVYNEPSELEKWCVPVVDEVDLVAYATGKNYYEYYGETVLVFAKNDNTKITFISGAMNGNKFEKQSELQSVTLNSGEGVLVHLLRPEVITSQAIIVENGKDKGMYVIQFDGRGETAKTEYIRVD